MYVYNYLRSYEITSISQPKGVNNIFILGEIERGKQVYSFEIITGNLHLLEVLE